MRDITDIQAVRPATNLLAEFDQVFLKDTQIPKIAIRSAECVGGLSVYIRPQTKRSFTGS